MPLGWVGLQQCGLRLHGRPQSQIPQGRPPTRPSALLQGPSFPAKKGQCNGSVLAVNFHLLGKLDSNYPAWNPTVTCVSFH